LLKVLKSLKQGDDEPIATAKCLLLLLTKMVRYVSESHLDKIFDLFFAERNNEIRSILGESLFILSLQLNMRRYWLQSPRYDQLTEAVF